MIAFQRVAQRELWMDLVEALSSHSMPGEVAALDELRDDAMRRPLGNADAVGDAAQTGVGLSGHAHQDMSVIGEKRPLPHVRSVFVLLISCKT